MIIFLSSSDSGLDEHRRHVVQALQRTGNRNGAFVNDAQASEATFDERLRELRQAGLVICLVGTHYGPERRDGTSYCEAELALAHQLGTTVLAYDQVGSRTHDGTLYGASGYRVARLQRFRGWLREHYPVTRFTTPADLAAKVTAHLEQLRAEAEAGASGPYVVREIQRRLRARADARFDAVSVTMNNLDIVYSVNSIAPRHEERVDPPKSHSGGAGANIAFALARLGLSSAVVGMTAADEDGQRLRRSLYDAGVNTDYLLELAPDRPERTGRAIILTDHTGQRTIYTEAGANDCLAAEVQERGMYRRLHGWLEQSRIVQLSSFTQVAERRLQESLTRDLSPGAVVALTPGSLYSALDPTRLSSLLARTNILFTSDKKLAMLLNGLPEYVANPSRDLAYRVDALLRWRHAQGSTEPMIVVVRRPWPTADVRDQYRHLYIGWGRKGYEGSTGTDGRLSREDATNIRDVTGTGAALAAGILYGLLQGRPAHECADLAYVLSMSTAIRLGTRQGVPVRSEVREQWQRWFNLHEAPHWL